MFLLCSDGLTRHVSDQEIAAVLTGETAPGVAQVLIDLALDRGARDNVTTVVVRCELKDGAAGDPGGGPGAEPLPEAWDEDPETNMPVHAPFHTTGGATHTGPAMQGGSRDVPGGALDGIGPTPGVLDPEPVAAPEDPLASILADGPADRMPNAGAADMADNLVLGQGRVPLDSAEDSDPLLAADPRSRPGAARESAASGGKTPAERLAGPLSGRGIRVGQLLCAAAVALVAAYILYNILTLP
jgi:hypothetical protein